MARATTTTQSPPWRLIKEPDGTFSFEQLSREDGTPFRCFSRNDVEKEWAEIEQFFREDLFGLDIMELTVQGKDQSTR